MEKTIKKMAKDMGGKAKLLDTGDLNVEFTDRESSSDFLELVFRKYPLIEYAVLDGERYTFNVNVNPEYKDTRADAIRYAKKHAYDFEEGIIKAIPDSSVPFCWQVINFTTKVAVVVWLDRDIVEDCCIAELDGEADWKATVREYLNRGGEFPEGAGFCREDLR